MCQFEIRLQLKGVKPVLNSRQSNFVLSFLDRKKPPNRYRMQWIACEDEILWKRIRKLKPNYTLRGAAARKATVSPQAKEIQRKIDRENTVFQQALKTIVSASTVLLQSQHACSLFQRPYISTKKLEQDFQIHLKAMKIRSKYPLPLNLSRAIQKSHFDWDRCNPDLLCSCYSPNLAKLVSGRRYSKIIQAVFSISRIYLNFRIENAGNLGRINFVLFNDDAPRAADAFTELIRNSKKESNQGTDPPRLTGMRLRRYERDVSNSTFS